MTPNEAYHTLKLKFTSGNNVPVERAIVRSEEFEALANFIEVFKDKLVLLDMGLSFSLCNTNVYDTHRDIKKVQADFQQVKDAWERK
jgi:hypothetical protein